MKPVLVLLLLFMLLFLSGCETFRGLGKDLEHAGEWIQHQVN